MSKIKRDHNAEVEAFKQPERDDPMTSLFMSPQSQGGQPETEHLKEIVKQSYSKKDIQLKTDLTATHIQLLTRMITYQDLYKSQVMKKVVNTFMELRVSHKRLGRKEFVQVAQSFTPQTQVEPRSFNKRFLGE